MVLSENLVLSPRLRILFARRGSSNSIPQFWATPNRKPCESKVLSPNKVVNWVKRFRTNGNVERKRSTGRPRLVSESDEKEFYKMTLNSADSSLENLSEE